MQKTAELIENAIEHVEELLRSDHISPELQLTCLSLRDHLKADLEAAKRAAAMQVIPGDKEK